MRGIERVLVVEDDAALAAALVAAFSGRAREIRCASSPVAVRAILTTFQPDLLVLDVVLEEGNAFDVLEAVATLDTAPTVIGVSGSASPDETFRLAQLGVLSFLPKPFTAEELEVAVARALSRPPDLRPLLRVSVGRRPMRDVEDEVRRTMVDEALGRAAGSRRKAAGLLSMSRQLLQHILRGYQ